MRENREVPWSPARVIAGGPLREGRGRTPEMNGQGKSDRPVVPTKPPNKAGSPVAEAVEGRGLAKGNAASKTRPGRRAGQGAPSALDRVRRSSRGTRRHGSRRCCTMSDLDRLRDGLLGLEPEGRRRGRRGDVGAVRAGPGGAISRICTCGSTAGRTGRNRLGGRTSRRRTGGSGRSASPRWRTRSSSAPSSRCSTPSTRWTFSASRTGSGRGAARMMRWTRSPSGIDGGR